MAPSRKVRYTLAIYFLFFSFLACKTIPEKQSVLKKIVSSTKRNLISGGPLLQDLEDKKRIVVEFWAPWCESCVPSMTYLALMQEQYKKDMLVIALSVEEDEPQVVEFIKKYGIQFPVAIDREGIGAGMSIEVVPTTLIFDQTGTLIYKSMGYSREGSKKIEEIIKSD